jgi:hypothetical protein
VSGESDTRAPRARDLSIVFGGSHGVIQTRGNTPEPGSAPAARWRRRLLRWARCARSPAPKQVHEGLGVSIRPHMHYTVSLERLIHLPGPVRWASQAPPTVRAMHLYSMPGGQAGPSVFAHASAGPPAPQEASLRCVRGRCIYPCAGFPSLQPSGLCVTVHSAKGSAIVAVVVAALQRKACLKRGATSR